MIKIRKLSNAKHKQGFQKHKCGGEDSRWRCENNPGLELALNPQTVSPSCISRLIVVAHRTGKLPSIKKTRDARQYVCLAKPAAGAAAASPTQQSPQGALVRVPC